jgi:hypothetical protein
LFSLTSGVLPIASRILLQIFIRRESKFQPAKVASIWQSAKNSLVAYSESEDSEAIAGCSFR